MDEIFPEDNNRAQSFSLPEDVVKPVKYLKFVFEESSDSFGRITMYNMQIDGVVKDVMETGQNAGDSVS